MSHTRTRITDVPMLFIENNKDTQRVDTLRDEDGCECCIHLTALYMRCPECDAEEAAALAAAQEVAAQEDSMRISELETLLKGTELEMSMGRKLRRGVSQWCITLVSLDGKDQQFCSVILREALDGAIEALKLA